MFIYALLDDFKTNFLCGMAFFTIGNSVESQPLGLGIAPYII